MTKFYANTEIQYGKPNDKETGESEIVVIPEGEEVKGLPKEVMAELWAAGSLRMEEGGDAKDPRLEAARHASYTGEGVDNELTNPDKAAKSKADEGKPSTSSTPKPAAKGTTPTGS
jgi:hypothetical protein